MGLILKAIFFCLIFCLPVSIRSIYAQGERLEQVILFSDRIKSPIEFEVTTDKSNLYFNVRNRSFFPYELELNFNECRNLSPVIYEKKVSVIPGPNRIFTLRIVDPQQPPEISYKVRYYISGTSNTEKFSPYLIPIGESKTVRYTTVESADHNTTLLYHFEINPGDTVFSARKGCVTALPDSQTDVDRIIRNSLEIRHEDGTVGVYIGLNLQSMYVRPGQTVYPGQPLGRISNSGVLIFQVYEINSEGKIRSTDILFAGYKNQLLNAATIQGLKVTYSSEIIKKEMTKKEIAKYEKKSLF